MKQTMRARAHPRPVPRRGIIGAVAPQLNSTCGVGAMGCDPGTGRLFTGGDFTRYGSRSVAHLAAFGS
jgi:hypothetical protein